MAFQVSKVEVPLEATIDAHFAQVHAPMFLPSTTGGNTIEVMDIGGNTPKKTLHKIELMVALFPVADRDMYQFIQYWGRFAACVASGKVGAKVNQSSMSTDWRGFFPLGTQYNTWVKGSSMMCTA